MKSSSLLNSSRQIARHFYSGNHPEVLAMTVDRSRPRVDREAVHFIIGSLAFMARLEEAEGLYAKHNERLSTEDSCAARFFLGLGLSRQSHYERARNYFFQNFVSGRRSDNPIVRFYCFQGVAFYRFFCGRFSQANRAAQRSHEAVFETNFVWGKILALDLMGHALVEVGEISRGFSRLKQALALAKNLGEGGIQQAIRITIACTTAQVGLVRAQQAIDDLEKLNREISDKDTYSRASILLELGRQYRLAGRIDEARDALNRSCQLVYGAKNRRQSVTLNLRYASLAFAQGEYEQALVLLGSSRSDLVPGIDNALETEVIGLEIEILEQLGMANSAKALVPRLRFLTFKCGRAIAIRIWNRRFANHSIERGAQGEDPLGDLLDRVAVRTPNIEKEIANSGYWALFYDILSVPKSEPTLSLEAIAGACLMMARGSVILSKSGISPISLRLLRALKGGANVSKQRLIEQVWGYNYHPLQHDSLIYSAVSRVKAMMGRFAPWLEVNETGYSLRANVRSTAAIEAPSQKIQERNTPESRELNVEDDLNHRQIVLLRELRRREFVSVRELIKIFDVAEITASRDLTDLCKKGLISRIGRGRATKYKSPHWRPGPESDI